MPNYSTLEIGKVVSIGDFNTNRTVDVLTMTDRRLHNCLIMDVAGHYEGDGFEAVPRIGSLCVVGEVEGYDLPFIMGFLKIPQVETGNYAFNADRSLVSGDYRIKTQAGSEVVWHSSGAIEITAKSPIHSPPVHFFMSPTGLANMSCRQYELSTWAGNCFWEQISDTDKTRFIEEVKKSINDALPVMRKVAGYADDLGNVYTCDIGNGTEYKISIQIDKDGNILFFENNSQFRIEYRETDKNFLFQMPDGSVLQFNKGGAFNLILSPESGGTPHFSLTVDPKTSTTIFNDVKNQKLISTDKDQLIILDSKNSNSLTSSKDGMVFQAKKGFLFVGGDFAVNTTSYSFGQLAALGIGGYVVTAGPLGSHPFDFFTGLPIGGRGQFAVS